MWLRKSLATPVPHSQQQQPLGEAILWADRKVTGNQHNYSHFPLCSTGSVGHTLPSSVDCWLQLFRTSKVQSSVYQVHQANDLRLNELFLETSMPYVKMVTPTVYMWTTDVPGAATPISFLRTESLPHQTPNKALESLN